MDADVDEQTSTSIYPRTKFSLWRKLRDDVNLWGSNCPMHKQQNEVTFYWL